MTDWLKEILLDGLAEPYAYCMLTIIDAYYEASTVQEFLKIPSSKGVK